MWIEVCGQCPTIILSFSRKARNRSIFQEGRCEVTANANCTAPSHYSYKDKVDKLWQNDQWCCCCFWQRQKGCEVKYTHSLLPLAPKHTLFQLSVRKRSLIRHFVEFLTWKQKSMLNSSFFFTVFQSILLKKGCASMKTWTPKCKVLEIPEHWALNTEDHNFSYTLGSFNPLPSFQNGIAPRSSRLILDRSEHLLTALNRGDVSVPCPRPAQEHQCCRGPYSTQDQTPYEIQPAVWCGSFQSTEMALHICCVRAEWLKTCGGFSSPPDLPCRACHRLKPMAYSTVNHRIN